MAFRRGFKSQCEKRSVELRKQLGLAPISPLSAHQLASHLGVQVWGADAIEGLSGSDRQQLFEIDPGSWSAFTLRVVGRDLIVYNPAQSKPRINSVVMHELSHIILGHELHEVVVHEEGHMIPGNYDRDQEDEADWLGGTLLLPRPALVHARNLGLSNDDVREKFEVSRDMVTWRFRMTGVDYQFSRR